MLITLFGFALLGEATAVTSLLAWTAVTVWNGETPATTVARQQVEAMERSAAITATWPVAEEK